MTASLRVRDGDIVTATDGRGNVYRLNVESTSAREVRARIVTAERVERRGPQIHLFQAVIKPSRMELTVEKAAELGLWGFTPVLSARSEAKMGKTRVERLRKAGIEAMKQSLGAWMPDVRDPASFLEAVDAMAEFRSVLVAWEGEGAEPLHRILRGLGEDPIALWIGPAGGFTEDESAELASAGGTTFTLGRQRLKSETAAIASLAIIKHLRLP